MSDWGVHLLDYALEGMGADLPTSILSSGGKFAYPNDAMETPDTLMATYAYKNFNIIWDHACGISHGLYGRKEGLAFQIAPIRGMAHVRGPMDGIHDQPVSLPASVRQKRENNLESGLGRCFAENLG